VLDPIKEMAKLGKAAARLPTEAQALQTLVASGMVGPERPDRMWAMYRALDHYGPFGAAVTMAAVRRPDRPALVDEIGTLTYGDLDRRSNAVANALRARGVGPGVGVGVMCRNHRGMFDVSFGVLKAGGRVLYLNTDFAAPQARQVAAREQVEAIVFDEEFADVVAAVEAPKGRFVAWTDQPDRPGADAPTLESVIASGNPAPPPKPDGHGTIVILTSGTTGTPKGAARGQPRSLAPLAAILSRIPFRAGEVNYLAPPVYHAWGLAVSILSLGLGSTLVVRRRFDPEAALLVLAEHRCSALTVIPVLLDRLVSLGPDRIGQADLSALRIVATSGSRLSASLATRTMDLFGDVVYNLYGSTEVAWATIATPEDLRAAPGCTGKPPLGTTVRIIDDDGQPRPNGRSGRIFVGSGMEFGGYTGGGSKETVDGLMATGDMGHFDTDGRLWVEGRDDEMIVSGGENVFPGEVEELLATHEAIADAAAVGVDDSRFGQRLRAYVVLRDGHQLEERAVREYVRANLARYKVPREVVFLDELPRNPSGKVLKSELARGDSDQ
jgi:fatty-acyl-CoA synthase